MASHFAATRQRKPRFSEAELTVLVEHIVENAAMLFSADRSRSTQQRHKKVWAEAARKCTAVGVTVRTVKDCHKRWDDLWLRVRNLIAAHCQHRHRWRSSIATKAAVVGGEVQQYPAHRGDTGRGVSPTGDAGSTSTESDTAQEATPRPPARDQRNRPVPDAIASTTGTQPPAPSTSGTDAPILVDNPVQPVATQATPITTLATESSACPVCTEEEAQSSGNSEPVVLSDDAGQEQEDMGDISPLLHLEFSPTGLHSPLRSPTPSMAEMSARLHRIEKQQASLAQLVEKHFEEAMQQWEEARLQRKSTATSIRRLSRAIGRFATTKVTLSRHVREGNSIMSSIAESMLVTQQDYFGHVPPVTPPVPSTSTTPSSSMASSPQRRSSQLAGPSGKDTSAQKRGGGNSGMHK
ncbi:myb-related transcription factor, partner of profilin-like [Ambystoma mexicanum]|uniref:myb-related transcription factor, partner of profilin-like n=1 Tax=Ambystoma mexicanum TaxID=8296 RepID=UPI0037E788C0